MLFVHLLYHADKLNGIKTVSENFISLVIISPPLVGSTTI